MLIITTEIYGYVREVILPSVHKYQFNVPGNEDWKYESKLPVFRKRGSATTVTFALDHCFFLVKFNILNSFSFTDLQSKWLKYS